MRFSPTGVCQKISDSHKYRIHENSGSEKKAEPGSLQKYPDRIVETDLFILNTLFVIDTKQLTVFTARDTFSVRCQTCDGERV